MVAEHLHDDGGEQTAWQDVFPLVYNELRAMARRQLRRERESHTLNTTGLVHETYLRLVNQRSVHWGDRARFFALAARVMRRVLIGYARQHRAAKRGAGEQAIRLEGVEAVLERERSGVGVRLYAPWAEADQRAELLLALDDALSRLAALDERLAQVVECRFFGGLSEEETAAALGVTARTIRRDWVKAKDWLRRELES